MAKLIDGRAVAEKVYAELRGEIAELKQRGITPGLAVVLVGDDPATRARSSSCVVSAGSSSFTECSPSSRHILSFERT